MAKVGKRRINLGTGSDQVGGQNLPTNISPSSYTPDSATVNGHLSGIDTFLNGMPAPTSGDINHSSYSLLNNQASYTDVTGLVFSNASVRSAKVDYSIMIDSDTDLFEEGTLRLVFNGSSWRIARNSMGDNSQIDFDVTASGQVQYLSPNFTNFVSGKLNFRATVTQI